MIKQFGWVDEDGGHSAEYFGEVTDLPDYAVKGPRYVLLSDYKSLEVAEDNPEFDATDAAHPAWWRGHEHTAEVFCKLVNEILDGKPLGGGIAGQPWEDTRRRLEALVNRPPKIMPVEQCGAVRKCMASPQSYASQMNHGFSYLTPSNSRIATFALQKLEEAWAADKATHEKNAAALEANQAVRERINELMAEVGIPTTKRVRDGNRMRYGVPKMKTVDAGYIEDIRAAAPITDGFNDCKLAYERLKPIYDKFAEDAEKEAEVASQAAERETEREKAERRANIKLAKIIIRYDLPEDISWNDCLDELRRRDQRLDLAVAMSQTRGDWSDGFWRVSDALGRFKIETDEDKDIVNDVVSCMNDDDGRVFRDTTWNYGRLFESAADSQLSQDIQFVMSKVDD